MGGVSWGLKKENCLLWLEKKWRSDGSSIKANKESEGGWDIWGADFILVHLFHTLTLNVF